MAISLKNIKSLVQKKKALETSQQSIGEESKSALSNQDNIDKDYSKLFCCSILQNQVKKVYNLGDYKVPGTNSAYYIKDYLNAEQEDLLLDCIFKLDQDSWFEMKSGRALKRYGGEVGSKGLEKQEPLPAYFETIADKLFKDGVFLCDNKPNHVLMNKYRPGDGIMPHKDGPAYFPFVCIISLHTGLILNIWEDIKDIKTDNYRARFYLEPKSLFIFADDHYHNHFHGIEEQIEDIIIHPNAINEENKRLMISNYEMTNLKDLKCEDQDITVIPRNDYRISLTIRYVPLETEQNNYDLKQEESKY